MRTQSITIGASSLLISVLVFVLSRDFPPFKVRGVELPGPAFFPNLIAAGLLICGLAEIALGLRGVSEKRGSPEKRGTSEESDRRSVNGRRLLKDEGLKNTGLVIAGVIAYALLQDSLGFLIATFLLCAAIISRLRVNWAKGVLISAIVTIVLAGIFARMLMVPLPRGILSFW